MPRSHCSDERADENTDGSCADGAAGASRGRAFCRAVGEKVMQLAHDTLVTSTGAKQIPGQGHGEAAAGRNVEHGSGARTSMVARRQTLL